MTTTCRGRRRRRRRRCVLCGYGKASVRCAHRKIPLHETARRAILLRLLRLCQLPRRAIPAVHEPPLLIRLLLRLQRWVLLGRTLAVLHWLLAGILLPVHVHVQPLPLPSGPVLIRVLLALLQLLQWRVLLPLHRLLLSHAVRVPCWKVLPQWLEHLLHLPSRPLRHWPLLQFGVQRVLPRGPLLGRRSFLVQVLPLREVHLLLRIDILHWLLQPREIWDLFLPLVERKLPRPLQRRVLLLRRLRVGDAVRVRLISSVLPCWFHFPPRCLTGILHRRSLCHHPHRSGRLPQWKGSLLLRWHSAKVQGRTLRLFRRSA